MVEKALLWIRNYNIGIAKYLTDLILKGEIGYNIRNENEPFFNCRTDSFKNSFFPYTIEAWFSLESDNYKLQIIRNL